LVSNGRVGKHIDIKLTALIVIGIVFVVIILIISISLSARVAAADATDVAVSYTPSYNTQYTISVPTGLSLNNDGSPTTLSISIESWSDFPTNKSLYCDLSATNTLELTNNTDTVSMTIKNGDTVVAPGDRIGLFTPTSLNSNSSASFIVLTVVPNEKPEKAGTYSGNLSFTCGIVD